MQILIPISGYSSFFPKEDYFFPKPLIEVAGRAMIDVVVSFLRKQFLDAQFFFVIDPEDASSFSLDRTLKLLSGPNTVIIEKSGRTSGALCSALLSVDYLNLGSPLVIVNCDQVIEADLNHFVDVFRSTACSAGLVTFDSVHPRWSYVVEDDQGEVIQAVEKKVASRSAIAGFYYFANAELFIEAAKKVILDGAQLDGVYYISSSINQIILSGGRVLHQAVTAQSYHSFYAPAKILEFERTTLANDLRKVPSSQLPINVIIPAAGEGSRFSRAGWKKPKPFIEVDGLLMLEHVINNLKLRNSTITILLRKEHMNAHPSLVQKLLDRAQRILPVEHLTEGTASTVLLARSIFDNSLPLIIANSDQLVDFNIDDFVEDSMNRKLDGSIVVFRDPTMDPKWSFVKVDDNGFVLEVAEKKAISDLATVGIYMFAKGSHFVEAAIDMIVSNDRTNNEFYTCPAFGYMIRAGARIGVYEIPMASMSGLGTPEDLEEFLLKRGASPSIDSPDDINASNRSIGRS
jgi:NDP-sugar pyrophosphorylase family protein